MIHIFRSRVSGERPEKSPFSNIGQNIDDRNGLKERFGGLGREIYVGGVIVMGP